MSSRLLPLVLAVLASGTSGAAHAGTLFVANGSNTLYTLDASTAAATAVGSGDFNLFELAFHPDGTLWAIGAPTTGGVQRLLTVDPDSGAATAATAGLTPVGQQGPRDMTFGSDGTLYVGHHRPFGNRSGMGIFEMSVLDGSTGDFIFQARGGVPIGTLANGGLFSLEYTSLLSVTPTPSATPAFQGSLTPPSAGTTCRFPQPDEAPGPPIPGYQVTAVDPDEGVAWVHDGGSPDELCRIDLATGEIDAIGDHGLGTLRGIAVQTVPEPAVLLLLFSAAVALAQRRP